MRKTVIKTAAPQRARRARELFSSEHNYRPKTVAVKTVYRRRPKHRHRQD